MASKRSYLKKSLFILLAISGLMIAYLLAVSTPSEVNSLSQITNHLPNTLMLFRWLLIIIIAVFWETLITFLPIYKTLEDNNKTYLLNLRWRVIGYLVAAELLIVDGLLTKFFAWVS